MGLSSMWLCYEGGERLMECSVRLVNITEDDYMNGHTHYSEEVRKSICDGIWYMDQCLARDEIAQIGRMLIRMAYSRDIQLRYPSDFIGEVK